MWMIQGGHIDDACDLTSTLCRYDFRKGDLFVLSWSRMRRVRQESISSELIMYGEGVRSILLYPLGARFLETIDVCIWQVVVAVVVVSTHLHDCLKVSFHTLK